MSTIRLRSDRRELRGRFLFRPAHWGCQTGTCAAARRDRGGHKCRWRVLCVLEDVWESGRNREAGRVANAPPRAPGLLPELLPCSFLLYQFPAQVSSVDLRVPDQHLVARCDGCRGGKVAPWPERLRERGELPMDGRRRCCLDWATMSDQNRPTTHCPGCGGVVYADAALCHHCGRPVGAGASPASRGPRCLHCGGRVSRGVDRCKHCGRPL